MSKIKKQKMLSALTATLGVVSIACDNAKINRSTHYYWMTNDEEYAKRVNDLLNVALDFAEASLLAQIKEKNTTATIFYLKTKGKERGYIETNEIKVTATAQQLSDSELNERIKELLSRVSIPTRRKGAKAIKAASRK